MNKKISTKILKLFSFFTILLLALTARAQTEKNEAYLFTCPISSSGQFEQVVLKSVQVKEPSGVYTYYTLDAEAGNQVGDTTGIGEHLKYVQTLFSSQNAVSDDLYQNYGDNFQLDIFYEGQYRDSKIQINLDKLHSGKYELSLNGSGAVFYNADSEYQDVLRNSEFYQQGDRIECFVHPHVNDYLDSY